MFSASGADVMVESGAVLVVQKNTATSQFGGGVYLQERGFDVHSHWQQHARDGREQYGRTTRRRGVLSVGADVMVESGAALVVQKNTATSQIGGGVYLESEGSTFTATGDSTRVTVESNTAGQRGGGVYSSFGADVMVESGAALVVQNNTATSYYGGGVYLQTRVRPSRPLATARA